jgi:predicted HTH transcriptional regulator
MLATCLKNLKNIAFKSHAVCERKKGWITNKEYQEIKNISNRTAAYELVELTEKHKLFKTTWRKRWNLL